MSSSPLYLAIVVVWLIVLVPMLLRKDSVDTVHEDPRREGTESESVGVDGVEEDSEHDVDDAPDAVGTQVVPRGEHGTDSAREPEAGEEVPPPGRYRAVPGPRARIIARRRRRTTGLVLVNVATAVAVMFGLGPWWVTIPPVLLLAGHLVLLREAAKADAEERRAMLLARRRALLRARRIEEERREAELEAEREAEVIALRERRDQVYDQYADARLRAAGD